MASPAPPSDQLTSESSGGGHFAKKEEINYEWAQVLSFVILESEWRLEFLELVF